MFTDDLAEFCITWLELTLFAVLKGKGFKIYKACANLDKIKNWYNYVGFLSCRIFVKPCSRRLWPLKTRRMKFRYYYFCKIVERPQNIAKPSLPKTFNKLKLVLLLFLKKIDIKIFFFLILRKIFSIFLGVPWNVPLQKSAKKIKNHFRSKGYFLHRITQSDR